MSTMEMSEFLTEETPETASETTQPEEIDVQRAVVESLAADKAQCDETISLLQKHNNQLQAEVNELKAKVEEMKAALANVGDVLAKNTEVHASSQVSLLDRCLELADRFEGETRDQVLEVITEARDQAEKDGRIRRAQLLEAVLVTNTPSGNLKKKREALKKFFADNENILSGPVIAELDKCGISYKNGEEYLLVEEILKRTY